MGQEMMMTQNLATVDRVYRNITRYASIQERIKYCNSLLQRTESFIKDNQASATDHILTTSMQIIIATREEINSLLTHKK